MDEETLKHIADHNKVIGVILSSLQSLIERQDRQAAWLAEISEVLDPGCCEVAKDILEYERREQRKDKFRIVRGKDAEEDERDDTTS